MKYKKILVLCSGMLLFLAVFIVLNLTTRAHYNFLNPKEIISPERVVWCDEHDLWKISLDGLPPSVFPVFFAKYNLGKKSVILFENGERVRRRGSVKDLIRSGAKSSHSNVLDRQTNNGPPTVDLYYTPSELVDFDPSSVQFTVAYPFVIHPFWLVLSFVAFALFFWRVLREINRMFLSGWLSQFYQHVMSPTLAAVRSTIDCTHYPECPERGTVALRCDSSLLTFSCLAGFLVVAVVVTSLVPLWGTNDDVGMSMLAHGYGFAFEGSERIIFSNILWGRFIRFLPEVGGVLGYSLAAILALYLSLSVFLYCLLRLGTSYLVSFLLCLVFFSVPLLQPQFTVTAGVATVVGALCLHTYFCTSDKFALAAGCVLAYIGFLIRNNEFFLVALVALPLFPLKKFFLDKLVIGAGVFLVVLILVSSTIDKNAYQTEDMKLFTELQDLRPDIIDYGLASYLKLQTEELARHNYSTNNLMLFSSWFFLDEEVCNLDALGVMQEKYKLTHMMSNAGPNLIIQAKSMTNALIIFIVLIVCVAMTGGAKKRLWWSMAIFVSVLVGIAVAGRPAILRVAMPPLLLLMLFGVLEVAVAKAKDAQRYIKIFIVSMLILGHVGVVAFTHVKRHQMSALANVEFSALDVESFVSWGAAFPFEYFYPAFSPPSPALSDTIIYGWGWATFLPNSYTYRDQLLGTTFSTQLFSKTGVNIISDLDSLDLLDGYCQEHFNGVLERRLIDKYMNGAFLTNSRCVPAFK